MISEMKTITTTTNNTSSYVYCDNYTDALNAVLELGYAVKKIGGRKYIAYDIETSGLDPRHDRLLFVQIYHEAFKPVIIDARRISVHDMRALLRIFMKPEWMLLGHNLKFDLSFTAEKYGIYHDNLYDTMLAEALLTAGIMVPLGLKDLALKYLGRTMQKEQRERFLTLGDEDADDDLLNYMAADVDVLPRIKGLQTPALKAKGLVPVAQLEFAVLPVLIRTELRGVKIDKSRWEAHVLTLEKAGAEIARELEAELQTYIDTYRNRKQADALAAYETALADYVNEASMRDAGALQYKESLLEQGAGKGEAQRKMNEWKRAHPMSLKRPTAPKLGSGPINLGSPQQLQGALGEMGVRLPMKNNGQLETDRLSLQWIEADYPIVGRILEYRGISKLVSSFGEAVLRFLDEGGRLHPEYRQLVSTGRMSCSKPNIQQVPNNSLGVEFRRCFVAPRQRKIVSADYSQIELRILYELAGQQEMIDAINEGLDLHSLTVARMFGMDYDYVKSHYEHDVALKVKRRAAKNINFGIAYGLTAASLSKRERIPMRDAKKYIDGWKEANPRVMEWLDGVRTKGLQNRYVETALGRKRFFNSLDALPKEERARAERAQMREMGNHPIQGTSADITKMAAVCISKKLREREDAAHLIMFVHDEVVCEVVENQAEEVAQVVVEEMKRAARYFLKKVNVEVGCVIAEQWEH